MRASEAILFLSLYLREEKKKNRELNIKLHQIYSFS
uniref:Uncharacterized protein n=1 Tax=Rhizophora mucronata TaxID=61149 RepID=A0A2P2KNY7_RHIMU